MLKSSDFDVKQTEAETPSAVINQLCDLEQLTHVVNFCFFISKRNESSVIVF